MKKYIAVAAAIMVFAAVAAFGAGDFNKPSGSSLRTNFMAEIRDMFTDLATETYLSTSNVPTNAIRYNATTHKREIYSGSTWSTLDVTGEYVGTSDYLMANGSARTATNAPGANNIPVLTSGSVLALPNATHTINGNAIWHTGNSLNTDITVTTGSMSAHPSITFTGAIGDVLLVSGYLSASLSQNAMIRLLLTRTGAAGSFGQMGDVVSSPFSSNPASTSYDHYIYFCAEFEVTAAGSITITASDDQHGFIGGSPDVIKISAKYLKKV